MRPTVDPIKTAIADPRALRSLDVVTADVKKVDAVSVAKGKDKATLLHSEGKAWEVGVDGGKPQKGSVQAIQSLLDAVQGKREIVKFYDGADFKKLDAEMKTPQAVVAVYVGGLEEPIKESL